MTRTPTDGGGRFAPTPTGRLHMGNARTAFLAWLSARSQGLRNILRVEDLDPKAIPAGCLKGQYTDLDWLGLVYDEEPRKGGPVGPYRQSERSQEYDDVLRRLDSLGLLYPCWCSRKEVRMASLAPHASDEGPVYAGTCRPKGKRVPIGRLHELPMRNGRRPALRIDVRRALERLDLTSIDFNDTVAGHKSYDIVETMGDFVVRRVDGIAAYQVACSWDDYAMGCTEVIRGCDLLPSTARQILILKSLGLPEPRYGHVGLVVNKDGERLAKRDDAIALSEMRKAGISAQDVIAVLAGMSGLAKTHDLESLTAAFNPSTLNADTVYLPDDWQKVRV